MKRLAPAGPSGAWVGLAVEDRRFVPPSDHAPEHKEEGAGLGRTLHTCYILGDTGDACDVRNPGERVAMVSHDRAGMRQGACP